MDIVYRQGNLLATESAIIVHGCNARGAFNSGIARVIREQLPFAYEAYAAVFHQRKLQLGEVIWAVSIVTDLPPKIVGNAITQADFGNEPKRYVDYDAVRSAMQAVDLFVQQTTIEAIPRPITVAMPRIGSGLGGGDWATIAQIIEQEAQHFTPIVYQL